MFDAMCRFCTFNDFCIYAFCSNLKVPIVKRLKFDSLCPIE